MRRTAETISMGHYNNCEALFINNLKNDNYTIIFKYPNPKDCKKYSKVLLDKVNEAKDAFEGNKEISIDVDMHGIVITNAVDNGIDMSIYMDDLDLMLCLDYISEDGGNKIV